MIKGKKITVEELAKELKEFLQGSREINLYKIGREMFEQRQIVATEAEYTEALNILMTDPDFRQNWKLVIPNDQFTPTQSGHGNSLFCFVCRD